jgi:hypothetical protein|tara:strand:+ start:2077 stop:2355 length:279 start_codon:yes stop_codon:yes gene_type:complete
MSAIFTRTLAATDTVTTTLSTGITYISVLCKTDNTGANGITVLGTGSIGGDDSNNISLKANESITIQNPDGRNLGSIEITCGAGSTGIVVAM